MKTLQLVLRILLSPIVFIISLGMMILFPGFMGLLAGTTILISKLLGLQGYKEDSYKDAFVLMFCIILYPIFNSYSFIKYKKFIE